MSLLAPRPNEGERASVLLPTVTCSSCSAPIPLSSLGAHVCQTPALPRAAPRPPQIAIPRNHPAQMPQRPSHYQEPSPSAVRPPFAGPSSAHPSPSSSEFTIPRRPSPNNLTPPDRSPNNMHSGFSSQIRTPSPTNPFFPTSAHSYGSNGMQEQMPMIDTTSGGESGMAGVGRRAFAAAAWGVRAGVALAAQARQNAESSPQYVAPPHPAPWHLPKTSPTPREPVIMPSQPLSVRQRPNLVHSRTSPVSGHSPPSRSRTPASPPQRPQSATSQRSTPAGDARRQESVSSNSSSRVGDSLAELLKGRASIGAPPERANSTDRFFEKVKEMSRSNTILSRTNTTSTSSAGLGQGVGMSRTGSGEAANLDRLVASPAATTFDLDDDFDDDEQHSALPWANDALDESPRLNIVTKPADPVRAHHRYPTAGSEASTDSSVSSSKSGLWGGDGTSGPESEVATPSQSWERMADGAIGGGVGRDILHQIGEEEEEEEEEEEGERVVFGPSLGKKGDEGSITASDSVSSATSRYPPTIASFNPTTRHADAQRTPSETHKPMSSHSQSHSSASRSKFGSVSEHARKREPEPEPRRKPKVCQKCGETVGGAKRFVERDGVVLCEIDWKKLYLPSCRRCNLSIEKSAVSSSDGQLKGKWHRACFTCTRCDKPFAGDSFYVHGGKPWCQFHYHEENGTLCASSSCRQPIEGPCVLTPGADSTTQRFHPGHLRCDHRGGVSGANSCREAMDEYYDVGGKRFCERHVREAMREGSAAGSQGKMKAEKRRTRLVDLPVGGLGL